MNEPLTSDFFLNSACVELWALNYALTVRLGFFEGFPKENYFFSYGPILFPLDTFLSNMCPPCTCWRSVLSIYWDTKKFWTFTINW